jgi:RNA polymerase sigma-70 factor (ECF subfamily)
MSQPSHDEVALIRRCLEGDQDAIRGLVKLYEGPVYHLLWRATGNEEDARDLVQETFVRTIRALDRFDLARPFRNWIFRIASNLAIDHLRRARLRTISINIDEDDESGMHAPILVDERARPDEVHEATWLSEHLARLVSQLPPDYRMVVHLRHKEQLAYEEIAKTLGIPLGTVKARLHRAHHRLRALWKGDTPAGGVAREAPGDK